MAYFHYSGTKVFQTILDITITGILTGGLYALVAAGFNLQYGVARILNIAYGEFIMIAALGTCSLYQLGVNPFVSLAIVGPATFAIAFIIHVIIFRRLARLSATIEAFEGTALLACFGILFAIQNAALLVGGPNERAYTFLAYPVDLFGAIFPANRLVVLLFAVVLGSGLYLFMVRTRTGKAIRAITQDATAARLLGIQTNRMQSLCFGLGALLAGFSGVFLSSMFAVTPFMGLQYTVIAIIVVVLGGLGNILGSMVGGIVLGLAGTIASYVHPASEMVAYYAIFVILIVVIPTGFFSRR